MINEEISDKAVRIAVSTVKLSGRALYQGLKAYVNHHKNKVMQKQERRQKPSILEKLRKFKETISKQPHRDKERRKERER